MSKEGILYLTERFGISEEVLKQWQFRETRKGIWICNPDTRKLDLWSNMKKFEFAGIRLLRKTAPGRFKPTTYGLQLIGHSAKKNTIELNREEFLQILDRGFIEKHFSDVENGFVILKYRGYIVGCGLYKNGLLWHQFPRNRTEAMKASGLF